MQKRVSTLIGGIAVVGRDEHLDAVALPSPEYGLDVLRGVVLGNALTNGTARHTCGLRKSFSGSAMRGAVRTIDFHARVRELGCDHPSSKMAITTKPDMLDRLSLVILLLGKTAVTDLNLGRYPKTVSHNQITIRLINGGQAQGLPGLAAAYNINRKAGRKTEMAHSPTDDPDYLDREIARILGRVADDPGDVRRLLRKAGGGAPADRSSGADTRGRREVSGVAEGEKTVVH